MIKSLANGQKPALIINEVQVGLLDPTRSIFPALAEIAAERNIVANIAALIAAFRAKGHPIFYTPAINRVDMADKKINTLIAALSAKLHNMQEGTPEVEHPPEIAPTAADFVIQRGDNLIAFHGTTLDLTLRRMGVETIVLTGISTNVAIAGMTMAAVELGYHAVIPEDCIAAADRDAHRIIIEHQLRMLATITSKDEVVAALGA
jgi:nicotinamidase-related amidase